MKISLTYCNQGAERVTNNNYYTHAVLMDYLALPILLKKFINKGD